MLVMPIKAVGKERPRYSAWTKSFYTPQKTKEFEAIVGAYAKVYMRDHGLSITDGPVSVSVTVYDKMPKSWSKKKKSEALSGSIYPMKTPDGDNVLKAILDGMQDIVYVNDKQVVRFKLDRMYAEEDAIHLGVQYL